jgi:hypothetical protein
MTRHVSAENLARFRAGDLRRRAARKAETHLEGCPRCRETESALAEIPALLAEAQLPQIPAHLAARIETALATEAAHRAAGSPSMRGSVPTRPGRAARTRSRASLPVPALRILTAAAVIVVIGGGGYELFSHLGGPSASSTASSASGSAGESGNSGAQKSGAAGPLIPGALAAPAYGPPLHYHRAGHLVTIRPVRTFTDYRSAQLSRQVTVSLAKTRHAPVVSPGSHADMTPQSFAGVRTGQLAACVSRVAGGRDVLLVDVARLNGAPATVIVTAARGSGTGQIWVVGQGCSGSASDVLAHRQLPGG